MSGRSLRASIDAHCRDCGACDAGSNWREHISCCPTVRCHLWLVRPMSRYVPDWLASRDPKTLPDGWCKLPMEDALTRLRGGDIDGSCDTANMSCGTKPTEAGEVGQHSAVAPPYPPEAVMGRVSNDCL